MQLLLALVCVVAITLMMRKKGGSLSTTKVIFVYQFILLLLGALLGAERGGELYAIDLAGSDGQMYLEQAAELDKTFSIEGLSANYFGYQIVLALVFHLIGATYFSAVVFNGLCLLGSTLLLRNAVLTCVADKRVAHRCVILMLLYTPFLYYALAILKEPLILLAISLLIRSASEVNLGKRNALTAIMFGTSCLIVASARLTYLAALPATMVAVIDQRRRGNRSYVILLLGVAVAVGVLLGAYASSTHSLGFFIDNMVSKERLSGAFMAGTSDTGLIGKYWSAYDEWSWARRLSVLPITASIQFSMPITFWDFSPARRFFPLIFQSNLNIIWLAYLGPWIIFTSVNHEQIASPFIRRTFWMGVLLWITVAYSQAGLLPRYAAVFYPMMIPAVAVMQECSRANGQLTKRRNSFFMGYYLLGFAGFLLYLITKGTT